jgi:hypothetical protein
LVELRERATFEQLLKLRERRHRRVFLRQELREEFFACLQARRRLIERKCKRRDAGRDGP